MSLIVAARFDAFPEAENAARYLFRAGFAEEDVSIFFVNPAGMHDRYPVGGDEAVDPAARKSHVGAWTGAAILGVLGAIIGALIWMYAGWSPLFLIVCVGVGAYVGSLAGGLFATRSLSHAPRAGQSTGVRLAGVLLSVHVSAESEAEAARLLKGAGGKDVEKAHGRWRDGNWVDFDPVSPPVLSEKVAPRHAGTGQTV